jgi:hypothetical protein
MKRWLAFLLLFFFVQSLWAQSPVRICFDSDEVGQCPSGWKSTDQKNVTKVYSVQVEGGQKFLHADAKGLSVRISFPKRWDLREYPILCWRWRPVVFPTGSNERIKGGADSVLGIYVVLSGLPFVRAIKYIWSDTLPVGAEFDSPYSAGTKIIVVRSGRELCNAWVTEERNVLLDYERIFGKQDEQPIAQGIAILTDSDNTRSRSVGHYGEMILQGRK